MKLASKSWLWGTILFVLLFLGFAAISLSSSEVDRLWLNAPDWSRAKWIGDTAIKQPVPIAVDDAGTIYLFTVHQEGGVQRPQVLAVDRQANVVWECTLDAVVDEVQSPQIHWDGQFLFLFWLDDQGLYTGQMDAAGNVLPPRALLSGEATVGSYDVAFATDGTIAVWFGGTRREPGVYYLPLRGPQDEATLVDPEGLQPVARYDKDGTLHAAWVTYPANETGPDFYYAAYPDSLYRSEQQVFVAKPRMGSDSVLLGPWFGADEEHAYLLWIESIRSGDRANQLVASYLAFPLGEPGLASDPDSVVVPDTDELAYAPISEGSLDAGRRVLLTAGQYPRMVSPSDVSVSAVTARELVLAVRAELRHLENNIVGQVGVLFLQDGAATSYQLLTLNPRFPMVPTIVSDETGQLYYTWIERKQGTGYQVYFASTSPDIRQALSALTWGDVGRMASDTFFGMLRGAVFFIPAALIWLAVPFILLALAWFFRRGSESLSSRANVISIVLALLAYWVGKLVSLASARSYVPFSAWIPVIPSLLGILLQVGVPILTTAIALWAARYTLKRARSSSALLFVVVYAGVDSLLTMAVYGGLLFDAF